MIDIVIVNYNSTDYLLKCLESVYSQLNGHKVEIFVQDNGSLDDVKRVRSLHPHVRLTENHRNLGFSAAVNQALKEGVSPYIVILNPDSLIAKGFFDSAIEYMENNPSVGIMGPRILDADGSVQGSARSFPTPLTGIFGRTSLLSKWFPNNRITRQNILTKKINGASPVEVDWVSGACMVVRRSALEQVGLMDERFFMYWEDVDWCRRMWNRGWKVVYYPVATIVHYVGGSSEKRPIRSLVDLHVSCYRFIAKYPSFPLVFMKPLAFLALAFRFFVILIFCFRQFTTRRPRFSGRPRLLFFITEDWYFWSHRLPIARSARDAGFEVVVVTRVHQHADRILREGFRLIPIGLKRSSKNIFRECWNVLNIIGIYWREKPDIVHHVAMKPVTYGSWAAWITRVPVVVNALAGLGSVFVARGVKPAMIRILVIEAYRSAFWPANTVAIFQNPEDLRLFVDSRIVRPERAVLIRGSGVDIRRFRHLPEPEGLPTVVLASRMLWDKGVGEFVEAARRLKQKGVKFQAILVGGPDPENPMSINEDLLHRWQSEGIIEWWKHRDDIPEIFAGANVVVLPSYREGLPKVLLEASSCGRAIVTTDVPGCREIVVNDENGLLVPPKDAGSLADALLRLLESPDQRVRMGNRGREIVETSFSEDIVVSKTMSVYERFVRGIEPAVERHTPLNRAK